MSSSEGQRRSDCSKGLCALDSWFVRDLVVPRLAGDFRSKKTHCVRQRKRRGSAQLLSVAPHHSADALR